MGGAASLIAAPARLRYPVIAGVTAGGAVIVKLGPVAVCPPVVTWIGPL